MASTGVNGLNAFLSSPTHRGMREDRFQTTAQTRVNIQRILYLNCRDKYEEYQLSDKIMDGFIAA